MSDHPERNLLSLTARGAAWVMGFRWANRVAGLISTLVLARLLVPADFGLVAIAAGFVQAVDALATFGVEDALIRESKPGRAMFDTAFTMNAIRGLVTAILVVLLAYPIAAFFKEARLAILLLVLGGALALSAFENIGMTQYRRDFAFEMEFKVLLIPRVISVITAISAAVAGAGYWSLVAGILVNRGVRLILSYAFSAYRPRLSLEAWRYLLGFSVWTWLTGLVGLISDRMPNFFLGRLFDTRHVGFFSLGSEIAALPLTELVAPLVPCLLLGLRRRAPWWP